MRDANSWSPRNLYNLWRRSCGVEAEAIDFTHSPKMLFQQRWISKALVRVYHGDFVNKKIFKRWYLPDTLPDVRATLVSMRPLSDDDLDAFAGCTEHLERRKKKAYDEQRKGLAPVGSLMLAEAERRIDVFIFRCYFAHSVYEARRLVVHGSILLNGKKHTNANARLAPGEMISVDPAAIPFLQPGSTKSSLTPFNLPPYASPFIPAYAEVFFPTCSAVYVRHPTARPGYSKISTPYDADREVIRLAWEWYSNMRPRTRSKNQMTREPENRSKTQLHLRRPL
ncbi:hypothetical protein DFJ58DRAFT_728498 [Suillus subalutaceus]|uniref:uncharacterized protein n=1 Tax=Suillus subalutaceus TaxID=48586 RepID=UPI001B87233E|nr:uncharacterized protein DFJ58DRAFT_728498 [Suillus subalutaceus]KAG1852429.1 hypothetical protein DFJ58DRAFT_728498 [Suillus subalutaceus]